MAGAKKNEVTLQKEKIEEALEALEVPELTEDEPLEISGGVNIKCVQLSPASTVLRADRLRNYVP